MAERNVNVGGQDHVAEEVKFQPDAESGGEPFFRTEDFIWLELSREPEVEKVFIKTGGDFFDVLIVVNDRQAEIRDRIYDRELAIISRYPHQDFAFRILPRMGLPLSDLISNSE